METRSGWICADILLKTPCASASPAISIRTKKPSGRGRSDSWRDAARRWPCGGVDVLGTAVVSVGDPNTAAESFDNFKEAVGEPLSHTSATLGGNFIHQVHGDLGRQFFFIDNATGEDLLDILTAMLPRTIWSMQRLTREKAFFRDRLHTILSEKQEIDEKLSLMFHQKLTAAPGANAAGALEGHITELSSMYSVMATDLHLVSDAVDTFDRDLAFLEDQASEFGARDDEAFPRQGLGTFREYLVELKKRRGDLRMSLDNTKAAIDIAQTHAEILRGSQSLQLQKQTRELLNQNVILQDERASLQSAASVVELVVVFYYTLVSWKTVAPHNTVENLSSAIKFGVVATFAFSVVLLTHYVAASIHKKRIKRVPVLATGALVMVSLAAMALLPGLGTEAAH